MLDLGATWKLPRLIGWARAQAVTLLGERIRAAEAVEWGMIYRTVADSELRSAAMNIAARLVDGPPGVACEVRHATTPHSSTHWRSRWIMNGCASATYSIRRRFKRGCTPFGKSGLSTSTE